MSSEAPVISLTNLADKVKKISTTKVKTSSDKKSKKAVDSNGNKQKKDDLKKEELKPSTYDVDDAFLKEVEALGGSKDDLDLIKDLDDSGSDSEIEIDQSSKPDSKLSNDLSQFMAGLGLPAVEEVRKKEVKLMDANDVTKEKIETEPKEKKNKTKEEEKQKKREEKQKKREEEKKKAERKEIASNVNISTLPPPPKQTTSILQASTFASTSVQSGEIINHSKYIHPGELVLEPRTEWFSPDLEPPAETTTLNQDQINILFSKAKILLQKENDIYVHDNIKSTSQKQFLSQLLTAGTLSDKISALTLLIQESPIHSVKYFDTMIGLCRKKSRGSALQAVAALKDIFVGGVLPNRKLKWFRNQPLNGSTPIGWLIIWAFEDWLKQYFFTLLQVLETLSHDPVVFIRSSTVLHIIELLKAKPEQEVNLLRLGVNKLGDSDRKVSSRVSYLLLQLEQVHPAMKAIIVESISELIFRSGSDYHARYYSIITLNQTILAHKDTEVANSLIRIYLSLFERLLAEWDKENGRLKVDEPAKKIKKPRWKNKGNKGKHGGERQEAKTSEAVKEEENAKMTSAILTGLNRAYPFSALPREVFDTHLNTLYRVTHSANFNTSIQALMLIFQISKAEQHLSDRYYRTLYESLLDPRLATSSKLRLYLNLLFKSLREDTNTSRIKAFAKRLLQMANNWLSIGVVAAVVFLVNELAKLRDIKDIIKDNIDESNETTESKDETEPSEKKVYDGRARDPLYANSDNSKLWEILPLVNHFHPTIVVYALGLLNNDPSLAKPDLDLHSFSHFLDRFVYKNPRQKAATKGGSIMQPLAGADPNGFLSMGGSEKAAVNTSDWKNINIEDVDAGERFFHQYFANRREKVTKKESKLEGDLSDNEDEVWDALVNSRPDIEGDVDEESLSGFSDEDDLSEGDFSDISMDGEEAEEGAEGAEEEEIDSGDEPLSLDELDDAEGLLGSDEEIDGMNDESEEDEEEEKSRGKRALEEEPESKKSKKTKLKDLPVFASVEGYAQYLDSSDEDYS